MKVNLTESSELFYTKAKITNSILSATTGDDPILIATDLVSAGLDVLEIMKSSLKILGPIGGINSAIALEERLYGISKDLKAGESIDISTVINVVGDVLGICSAAAPIAGPAGMAASQLLLVLSASAGALANLVQSFENNEIEVKELLDTITVLNNLIFTKEIFITAIDNFVSFSNVFDAINDYFTNDEIVLITENSSNEIIIKQISNDPDIPSHELITESKLISIQDAINYAIQYDIKGITVDSILHVEIDHGTQYRDEIHSGDFDDTIKTSDGDDLVTGGDGADIIFGENGDDELHGDDGSDRIYGGDGEDALYGGAGNDILIGGEDIDTYHFAAGDGNDVIYTSDGADEIQIAGDYRKIEHGTGNNKYDLIITYGNNDSITIKDFYLGSGLSMINELRTTNYTLNKDNLINAGLDHTMTGSGSMLGLSEYSNHFTGYNGSYRVIGGNLNDQITMSSDNIGDIIYAGNGDDKIILGGGVNFVNGGNGNDYYALGSGTQYIQDTEFNGSLNSDEIHFYKNIELSGIKAEKRGNDMFINIGDGDSVTILNWYSSSGYKIEKLSYNTGNGTVNISWQQLEEMAKEHEQESVDHKLKEMFDAKFKDDFFAEMKQMADEQFVSPVRQKDPLVIDLNGDGIHTVGTNLNVHFDHDGDGNKEQTGWISDSDGFVVLDKNGNGLIDNGTEMFGENTLIDSGDNANDGYQALANFDSNADGKIDSNDSIYSQLKIWNDRNYNGISEEDELSSLADLGIKSISVIGTDNGAIDASGNTIAKTGTVEFENGTTGISNSLEFTTNEFSIDENGQIIVDDRLNGITNIDAIGFARSLLESGTLNKELGDLILQFKNSDSREERESLTEKILVSWAKTAEYKDLYERVSEFQGTIYPPNGEQNTYSQGYVTSSWDKLAIAEIFSGKTLMGVWTQMFNTQVVSRSVLEFYEKIHDYVYSALTDSVRLYEYKQSVFIDGEANNINVDLLISKFEENFETNPRVAFEDIYEFNNLYKDELIAHGFDINKVILDKVATIEITDTIKQSLDSIGYHFVDNGYVNIDAYNADSATLGTSKSKVAMGNDNANTISVNGDGAVIYGLGGDDVITGLNNGSQTIYGGDGNDVIDSGYGPDVIFGGDGDDIIGNSAADKAGSIGNYSPSSTQFFGNTINGGKGNDTIYGSAYGDIYYFNRGDGQDVILEHFNASKGSIYTDKLYFGTDIQESDVVISASGNDLILSIFNSDDKITLKDFLNLDSYGRSSELEEVHFQNGEVWNADYLKTQALTKYGDDGDNTISGNGNKSHAETIYGLGGNDTIWGNAGSDTIYGGDGNDIINGGTEQDFLYGEDGNDTINGGLGIDYIDGGDGNDIINGNEGPDILNGGDGDDIITAGAVDGGSSGTTTFYGDTITGGKGNDKLYGSSNGDKYLFGIGDGIDTIYEVSQLATNERTTDRIIFSEGILQENVVMSVKGLDLIITFTNSTDKITVINQFADTFNGDRNQKIEEIVFSDGTKWGPSDITSKGMITFGTSADDLIYGNTSPSFSDTILGGDGNDTIYGNAGGDFIYGERGNDILYGGTEADLIDGGEGDDIINGDLGPDILIGGDGNDIIRAGNTGSALNSTFYGDTITGGRGDDEIYGSTYGDIYHFNKGDGNDIIHEASKIASSSLYTDKLIFGSDITLENTVITSQGDDLIISFKDSDDTIKVINQFYESTSTGKDQKIDEIHFADGTVWDAAFINQSKDNLTQAMAAFNSDASSEAQQQIYLQNEQLVVVSPQ